MSWSKPAVKRASGFPTRRDLESSREQIAHKRLWRQKLVMESKSFFKGSNVLEADMERNIFLIWADPIRVIACETV